MTRSTTLLALSTLVLGCGSEPTRDGSPETQLPPGANQLEPYRPDPASQVAVVSVVQQLFDALESGDEALLRSVVDPSVVMHFSETRDGQTSFGSATLDGLANRITSSEVPLIERMWDPVVVIDGPLATLWAPYDFYAGDVFSHCGVDSATLLNGEQGWRIVGLSWTRQQPPDCPLHPDGPPTS